MHFLSTIYSKIALKIGIIIIIQIAFIITSFGILSYYQSQGTHLGNSINIAGKNRFLTSNLMFQLSEHLLEKTKTTATTTTTTAAAADPAATTSSYPSKIDSAAKQLELNILGLKQGGKISGIDLKPLPSQFSSYWNTIYQKWVLLKTAITDNILSKPNERNSTILTKIVEPKAASLIDSSNLLVTQLGEYAKNESQTLIFLETIFAVANIAVSAVILYLVVRILKPIFDLNKAMLKVKKGNLEISVKQRKGNDELSTLTESFNSMVDSIRNYIITQNDLTGKLKESYERLEQTQKTQKEFIDIAAHELRSPIQPILGLSDLLHTKIKDEQQSQLLDIVVRNAKRLQHLTEDILDVSKIESHSLNLNREQFDLNKVIKNAIYDFRKEIEKTSCNIAFLYQERILKNDDETDDDLLIQADVHRLTQVISNLLSNAIKFTHEGTIVVTTRKDNTNNSNLVIVSIKDTGNGIDPEILPRLFTKFATKSNRGGGTGLGLFISKNIIEAHGGKIWAENNKGSKGATFSFSLPISG
jgi:signal transduction histidine kinase